jgi:hypothetical protein
MEMPTPEPTMGTLQIVSLEALRETTIWMVRTHLLGSNMSIPFFSNNQKGRDVAASRPTNGH